MAARSSWRSMSLSYSTLAAALHQLQGVALVQTDHGALGQGGGAQQGGAQGGDELAGALEVQTGGGILQLGQLEQLYHHVVRHQQGIHLVGGEFRPEIHQIGVGQHTGLGHREDLRLVVVAVAV